MEKKMPQDTCDACLVARRDDAPVAFIVRVTVEVAAVGPLPGFEVESRREIRLCRRCWITRETMAEDGDDPLA
jgi:hypothetical protein